MGVFGASKREAYCRSDEFLDQTNGLPYNSSGSRAGNIYRSILIIFVLFFVLFGCFILLSSSTVGLFFFRISLDVLSPKVFNYNLNNPRGIEKSCWDGLWASQGASGNNNCCLGNTRFNQSWNNWFWFFFFLSSMEVTACWKSLRRSSVLADHVMVHGMQNKRVVKLCTKPAVFNLSFSDSIISVA